MRQRIGLGSGGSSEEERGKATREDPDARGYFYGWLEWPSYLHCGGYPGPTLSLPERWDTDPRFRKGVITRLLNQVAKRIRREPVSRDVREMQAYLMQKSRERENGKGVSKHAKTEKSPATKRRSPTHRS